MKPSKTLRGISLNRANLRNNSVRRRLAKPPLNRKARMNPPRLTQMTGLEKIGYCRDCNRKGRLDIDGRCIGLIDKEERSIGLFQHVIGRALAKDVIMDRSIKCKERVERRHHE